MVITSILTASYLFALILPSLAKIGSFYCFLLAFELLLPSLTLVVIMKRKNVNAPSSVVCSSDEETVQDLVDVILPEPRYTLSWMNTIESKFEWDIRESSLLVAQMIILRWKVTLNLGRRFPKGATPVTHTMLHHWFPMPLDNDIAYLYVLNAYCQIQLYA